MPEYCKLAFIAANKLISGWSFGIGLTYDKYTKECYLWFNIFIWQVFIGKIYKRVGPFEE